MARALISMAAGVIGATLASGWPGTSRGDCEEVSFLNDGGSAQYSNTVTVGSTSASTVHTFTVAAPGVPTQTISYTSADSTAANAATGLETALRKNGIAYGLLSVSRAAGVITVTGRKNGQTIVLAGASNVTLGSPTVAADAERIESGRLVIRISRNTTGNVIKGRKAVSSAFSAQRITHVITSAASAVFSGRIRVNGRDIAWGPVLHSTDSATTNGLIVTAINTALDDATYGFAAGQSVVASASTVNLRLDADVPGTAFESEITVQGSASASAPKTYTTGGPGDPTTSLPAAVLGLVAFGAEIQESGLGTNDQALAANAGGRAMCNGPGLPYVENSETNASGTGVWVDCQTTTATERGKCYGAASASSSRVSLWDPSLGWVAVFAGENDAANNIAAIRFLRRAPSAI